jgi:uncharacterized protein (UPF0332 family)
MSQAQNNVRWCLNKAAKEIDECNKSGKRPVHRGLVLGKPDIEAARRHLEKATHYLQATQHLIKGEFADIGASTLFYSMYHCFLAIAMKFGYESRNQTCTISLIAHLIEEKRINLDKRYINLMNVEDGTAIMLREEYTYGISIDIKEGLGDLLDSCKELIDQTKEILYA